MVCASAEELQARIALRALWEPCASERGDNDDRPWPSALHLSLRDEVDTVLRTGFSRRLERLHRRVSELVENNDLQTSEERKLGVASGSPEASVAPVPARTGRVYRPKVAFGPSKSQLSLVDPPEKKEEIIRQSTTLRTTLSSLKQILGSRERQISSLKSQLHVCSEMKEKREREALGVARDLKALADPNGRPEKAHQDKISRHRGRIQEMADHLREAQDQARFYKNLTQQQRAFFLQSERVAAQGGTLMINRHPTGEIFLVSQPAAMDDDMPKPVWDVGTAIANPYVCDSWPFEPNVLARRTFTTAPLSPFTEETPEDLEDEPRRGVNHFRSSLNIRLPLPGRDLEELDDYDDRYNGPSDTARSV